MIEAVVWCVAGLITIGLIVVAATRRRRAMRRHPSPTFVFADLAGYTALTEAPGDEATANLARVSAHDVRAQPGARRHAGQVDG
jgi:class 3 adenylate cyclase